MIKFEPLAFDSFSVRSMSTFIDLKGLKILIDPGIALGPLRFGLPPSDLEEKALDDGRKLIMSKLKKADVISISHYHYDHYPFPDDNEMNNLFAGKRLFIKDFKNKINRSQSIRGYSFYKKVKSSAEEVSIADGETFEIDGVELKFTEPVFHGPENSRLGYVNMLKISYKNDSIMHCSDSQGPISDKTTELIIKENPKIMIIDGPPTYLAGYRLSWNDIKKAKQNFLRIISKSDIKLAILDHHLLRDLNYKKRFNVYDKAKESGCKVMTAAEYSGKEVLQLEARRRELSKK